MLRGVSRHRLASVVSTLLDSRALTIADSQGTTPTSGVAL